MFNAFDKMNSQVIFKENLFTTTSKKIIDIKAIGVKYLLLK